MLATRVAASRANCGAAPGSRPTVSSAGGVSEGRSRCDRAGRLASGTARHRLRSRAHGRVEDEIQHLHVEHRFHDRRAHRSGEGFAAPDLAAHRVGERTGRPLARGLSVAPLPGRPPRGRRWRRSASASAGPAPESALEQVHGLVRGFAAISARQTAVDVQRGLQPRGAITAGSDAEHQLDPSVQDRHVAVAMTRRSFRSAYRATPGHLGPRLRPRARPGAGDRRTSVTSTFHVAQPSRRPPGHEESRRRGGCPLPSLGARTSVDHRWPVSRQDRPSGPDRGAPGGPDDTPLGPGANGTLLPLAGPATRHRPGDLRP